MKTLYLIRGPYGSGKTTLAMALAPGAHVENDHFYPLSNGGRRSPNEASALCLERVETLMEKGEPTIAVSNCFIGRTSVLEYERLAQRMGYRLSVVCMQNAFGSTHAVSEGEGNYMRQTWSASWWWNRPVRR